MPKYSNALVDGDNQMLQLKEIMEFLLIILWYVYNQRSVTYSITILRVLSYSLVVNNIL
jgi:hypothetical protein